MTINILVGVEGDRDGRDAVALGVDLAHAYDGSLELVGVYTMLWGPAAYAYEIVERQEVEARLARAAGAVPDDVRHQQRAVPSTSVVRGLQELAEREAAALLVIGPTRHGRLARTRSGDVTLGLLQATPCAVAIAPASYADAHVHRGVVGVAYVPAPEGREALATAADLARRTGATLRILHSGPATEVSEQLLADARADAPAGIAVETVLLDGVEPDRMLRTAAEDLDVLVMGSRGYGPTRRVLLGSVSAGLVHGAACPVIVVPRGVRVGVDTTSATASA